MLKVLILTRALVAGLAHAQVWEVGAIGGYGFSPTLTVKNASGSATTGFENGVVAGAFGGGDTHNYWSGEARYLYRYSDAKLSSGGTTVDFGAHTHIINGDILGHFRPRESRIRPFIAFGGGIKVVVGTGLESASQALGKFAALTKTHETLPVGDIGVGVKVNSAKNVRMRLEVQDFIGPAPDKVIAVAPGATGGGIQNDIIGTLAISYTW
jgi:hypothetical protein